VPATSSAREARSVLLVCTGNICRSPAAELLLRRALGDDSGVRIGSAGLEARVGESIAAPMASLLRAEGLDPAGFAARQIEAETVRRADLVLTMTGEQRSAVVRRVPLAVRRTFTVVEFAGLCALVADEVEEAEPTRRLAALILASPRARSRRRMGGQDDIEDPYRLSEALHARAFDRIRLATDAISAVVRSPAVDAQS
jgi:protein-tyrosine phosphatase